LRQSAGSTGRNQPALFVPAVPHKVDLVQYWFDIEEENRQLPTNDADLVWDNRGHTPVSAPDGHQVTFGEFNKVYGQAEVASSPQGTSITIQLGGLIPNGQYSLWILTFKVPGFHGNYVNLIGNGALPVNNGTDNTFTASSNGSASISATMRAQSLSLLVQWVVAYVLNMRCTSWPRYHSKNLIHNGTPGDPGTWVTQFMFPFRGR
jgi:hypothetical protein